MELRKDLELVEVEYEDGNKKVVLTFLDRERKQVRVVNFNRQVYRDGKYVDDDDKAAKVDQWCADYFGCEFSKLNKCVGQKKDVYCYEKFNSLWEVEQIEKFTVDMVGQIYQTEVKEITVDDYFIKIRYEIEGKTYESKMTFGTYFKTTKEWYQDPVKKEQQYRRFFEKYHVPVERKDELIGHPLMVEVKSAFGSNYYGDIKKFPQGK
jgi:hypothetical protein